MLTADETERRCRTEAAVRRIVWRGSIAPEAPRLNARTGEPRVDAALKLLERLPGLPVSDHPELFEQVHAQLSEVLGELDSGPAPAGPPPAEG